MLLTPFECAVIMSVIEGKNISVRKVYYLINERYELLGVKVGRSVRISDKEIKEYYDFRRFRVNRNISELAGYFKRGRNSFVLKCKQDDCLPPDFVKAIKRLQSTRRAGLEHKQRRSKNLHKKKRNYKQLEFPFK